jgi:hypothetical protein
VASVGVVFVHGLFSSRAVWSEFERLIGGDPGLARFDLRFFEYSSPKIRINPLRRIPDFDDLGDSLATYLRNEAADLSAVALVTHSQGGLVVQRCLAHLVSRGRGHEHARVRQVVMFACPNDGSEFARSLRGLVPRWSRSTQERDLIPINKAIIQAREAVLNRVVHAKSASAHEYPVRIQVYAGDADNIVKPESARSVFPDAGTLPGDHSGIVRPDSAKHRSFTTLRSHLLGLLDTAAEATPVPRATGAWQRPLVGTVRRAIEEGERHLVLYGLPRTGKSTAAEALRGDRFQDVVLDSSHGHPDSSTTARLVAVPPLSRDESLALLEHELTRHDLHVDAEAVLRLLPPGPLSLPGALCAYVAEMRHTPPELLSTSPMPAAVAAELAPVAALVTGLRDDDLAALATFALLEGAPLGQLLEADLLDRARAGSTLANLAKMCVVTLQEGAVTVPAVVVDALPLPARSAAAQALGDRVREVAHSPMGPALAACLPVLAKNCLALRVLDRLDMAGVIEQLNAEGHWPQYVALTRVLIDALDQREKPSDAVSARYRLARKVAQQGDLELAWALLREAAALIGEDASAEARTNLHSHRAFLAHLTGDSAYALQELERSRALTTVSGDPVAIFMARKLEGNIRLRMGDHEDAAECFTSALTVDVSGVAGPRLEAEVSLAHCELRLGRLEAASERLDRVLAQTNLSPHTERPRALLTAALLADRRSLPAKALELARQAADADARDPAVRKAIARTVRRLERFGDLSVGQYGKRP